MAWRAIRYNIPGQKDQKLWEAKTIHKGETVHPLFSSVENRLPPLEDWAIGRHYRKGMSMDRYMEKTGTVAFLVLRGDSIIYENYFKGFNQEDNFTTFSLAKVYVSTLTGIAIKEGYINSIDESISEYLPWCSDSVFCSLKIRHLLQMTSGLKSGESYFNPWATSTKLYYGDEVMDILTNLKLKKSPGKSFSYQNINSQLLGMIIANATGRSMSQYLEEKIWMPLGMESDAEWNLHEGTDLEKSFCCLNAKARDFARLGLLFMNNGKWEGKQIVPEEWISQLMTMDTSEGSIQHYEFNWYTTAEQEDFYGQGLLGQFIYVSPSTNTVIVRLGNSLDYLVPWYEMFKVLAGLDHKPEPMEFKRKDLKPYAGRFTFGESNFGDSTIYGKDASISATRKGLRVKTSFNKTWVALPENDSTFYNMEYSRWLVFGDEKNSIFWERSGNSWQLKRKEKKKGEN